MQRIQIGVVGLVTILMLVSLANFVLERAEDEEIVAQDIPEEGVVAAGSTPVIEEEPPAEPLAELGVTPTPEPEPEGEVQERVEPLIGTEGQVVPDLKPDPNLESPMDEQQQ